MQANRKIPRWRKALICAFLLSTGTLQALDPAKSLFQYNCQNWTGQNGLPADLIISVAQTRDGYLWLGTQKGLYQFDGMGFKPCPLAGQQTAGRDIKSLCAGKAGGLWAALGESGFGLYDGHKLWPTAAQSVTSAFEASDGAVWTASHSGVSRWLMEKEGARQTFFGENLGDYLSFSEGPQGRLWIGTVERGLWYWQAGKLCLFPDDSLKKENIRSVLEDAEGQIWVGTQRRLRCYNSSFQPKPNFDFLGEVDALLMDRHNVVWVGTAGGGLARYQGGEFTFLRKADGLVDDSVTSLYEDHEGSLWVGTRLGLSQIADVKFPIYSTHEGLPYGSAVSLCNSRTGGLWITTDTGLGFFDGHTMTNFAQNPSLPHRWMKRVFEASNGDLYLVDDQKQLLVFSGEKVVRTYTNEEFPSALAEDAESVLLAISDQLYRVKNGQFLPYSYAGKAAPVFYWINNLYVARDGTLWVASNNGIFRLRNGEFQQWSSNEGLADNRVNWVFQDEDDALWAGLANGIARLKNNQIKNLTPEHGLPGNTVYAIVPDDRGDFWMDTSSGILKASRQDLNEFADGKLPRIEYMLFDGLESAKVAGRSFQEPVACKTADGRIWIPNLRGLVMIDPAHLMTNRVVPPVHIEKIRIDGIEVENRQVPALRGGNGQMEFHFTALSYIAPQRMKLRYQLAGFDKEWVDADGRRSVVYDNLKPGKYSFRVQACNADGLWNTTGDTFEVELPPAFFQTTWFFAICALLGAGGIGLLYRWLAQRGEKKERKLKAANDLLDSKVRLRTAELAAANSALAVEIRAGERAEEALRAEQRLLRTMIDALPMYIACIDKNGKVVFANNLVSTFFGKPLSQIEGRHFKEVMPVEICVKQQGFIANCLAGRAEPFVHEYTLPNGAKVIGQGAFAPVSDKDGTIIGAVCGLADITERRQAEEELRGKTAFFEALVESSLDGILVVGNDRRKILQNKQAIDLWQIPASLTAGNDDAEQARFVMNMAKNPEEFLDDVNHLYAHPGVKDRREVELKNGTVLDRYSSSVIGKDGRYYGRIWMFRDITARKQMELEIEQTHQQLMAASRQAGMAEVATGVLHNVGNVLNSVNVSANLVVNALRSSRAATLAKVVQLLEQHKTDLADFITRDERGRNLPAFLASLDDHLAGERKHLVEELRSLLGNIEHINEIVAVQQANAHRVGVLESVQPSEIMETAIKMNQASYHSHEVEIIRDFEKAPPLLVDKHKVLQILINLLQNAKRACSQSRGRSGRVTVRIRPQGERGIRLEVADNGIGIPPENLTRIFSHGFTTQKDGHGFGLHSGALTAQDLGGTLVAHSDGPDEGATFILELPVQLQALAAANPGRPTPSEHSNSPSSATLIKGRPASLSPAPAGTETVRAG